MVTVLNFQGTFTVSNLSKCCFHLKRVTDSGGDGKVVMSKVANAPLEQKMLDTKVRLLLEMYRSTNRLIDTLCCKTLHSVARRYATL